MYRLPAFAEFARSFPEAERLHDGKLFYIENCQWTFNKAPILKTATLHVIYDPMEESRIIPERAHLRGETPRRARNRAPLKHRPGAPTFTYDIQLGYC